MDTESGNPVPVRNRRKIYGSRLHKQSPIGIRNRSPGHVTRPSSVVAAGRARPESVSGIAYGFHKFAGAKPPDTLLSGTLMHLRCENCFNVIVNGIRSGSRGK
ncbi:hypothetical protein GWI33_019339 [Rhynchophorus ferrugineus]|uniref:Uncharacterized protein n=1 Tax=Rhynchophorus ferrugineus TaxID=354439 RepID=A0A834M1G9_RHYFE|nr:hypothetical protein GWI33_019339 [Rhynchophorus ferrugineus]